MSRLATVAALALAAHTFTTSPAEASCTSNEGFRSTCTFDLNIALVPNIINTDHPELRTTYQDAALAAISEQKGALHWSQSLEILFDLKGVSSFDEAIELFPYLSSLNADGTPVMNAGLFLVMQEMFRDGDETIQMAESDYDAEIYWPEEMP